MAAEEAGGQTRAGLERARQEFRDEARRLYEAAREAPGGRDAIVGTTPVKSVVGRIRRDLPPAADGDAASQFTPEGLERFLARVENVADSITIDQARRMRTMVNDAIDDKTLMPGVPERYLGQLSQALTRAIEEGADRAGFPQLRQALSRSRISPSSRRVARSAMRRLRRSAASLRARP